MCAPDKCPFFTICEERKGIAEYFLEQREKTQDDRIKALEAMPVADEIESVASYALASLDILRTSVQNAVLACDIAIEDFSQQGETILCRGAIMRRKYGVMGPVVSVTCGSEDRKTRLQDHSMRLLPPQETALQMPNDASEN